MEVEFVACFEAIIHALWLPNFISRHGVVDTITKPLKIYCDNSAAVFFSKNDKYSKCAKHIELKYFTVKEEVQKQRVSLEHIRTDLMIADPLMKGGDQGKEKNIIVQSDVVGTAAASTKILTSGKILGKPVPNATRNEWMQRRKNKYQSDSRCYIIKEAGNGDVANSQELKEMNGEELTGKSDDVGKEKSIARVQTSNMFELLEKCKVEVHKQIKKEEVDKVLNKEKVEAKANPTRTRKGTPNKAGMQNPTNQMPSPSDVRIGIEEANKKESTIEWVHRRFGTSKEELREMNVTLNHSCHEIPSQTYDDSKGNEANIEASSGRMLWSDEAEIMEVGKTTNNSTKSKEERGIMLEKVAATITPLSTVNPIISETRVEGGERDNKSLTNLMIEGGEGMNKELVKKLDQLEKPQLRENQWNRKTTDFNGTVKSRQLATEISGNPNIGDVYTLQFNAIQEAMRAKELNARVLKEATDRAHDQIELPVNTGISETGHSNKAIQIATLTIDDPRLLAGKTFSVTGGILAKCVLINNRGQKELEMISKNHEPNLLASSSDM
ncbi:hypothetical protein A4A49_23935 [Nicotiana attenuata]|uniref:Retrovirus-related pol polyprotein from transposon tnt 1-94 n=1 Tax=Nicotiana attenuata TaxID=49451 RepID=A0A1J6IT52_NICAT|nr:hypothetical protein A4A49_23935 [Nicotiana attenuata]